MAREAMAEAAAGMGKPLEAAAAGRAAAGGDAAGDAERTSLTTVTRPTAKDILMSKAGSTGLLRQRPRGVFAFPALTPHFCRLLREEKEHFERSGMPCVPPNTMNKNGLLLYELGMHEGLLDPLLERYILPLSTALYGGNEGNDQAESGAGAARTAGARPVSEHTPGASSLDHSRSFTVSYEVGKSVDLAYHYDDSEVTLNINLGGEFEGGELLFGGVQGEPPEAHRSRYPHFHRCGARPGSGWSKSVDPVVESVRFQNTESLKA